MPHKYWLPIIFTPLLLHLGAIRVLAHGGHGEEFQNNSSAAPASQIQVDAVTARRMGLLVQPLRRHSLARRIRTTGQIEIAPNQQVEVTNPVGGRIVRLFVQPGDPVRAGQPLAILLSPELATLRADALDRQAQAQAELRQAQVDLQLAEENYQKQQQVAVAEMQQAKVALNFSQERYERDRELLEKGAIPRRQMLESQSQFAEAQAALIRANSRIPVAEAQAQLKRARSQVVAAQTKVAISNASYQTRLRQLGTSANPNGTVTITAPIAGTIADREITLGQSAEDAGAKLMTIVNGQRLQAVANIYEKDLPHISRGQSVEMTVNGLPNQRLSGRIAVIGTVVQGETRVVPVQVVINGRSAQLKPGMFTQLEVVTGQTGKVVNVVPHLAIVEANGKTVVYVQNGQAYTAVEVELGQTDGDWVEIKTGLFAGDQVVVQGAPMLYAQSLRGSRKPETPNNQPGEQRGGAAPTQSSQISGSPFPYQLPLTLALPSVAATALGMFWAGNLWAKRRQGS